MATWMALCDPRIKAANVICYSDRFSDMGMRDVNFCGSQITPGLYALWFRKSLDEKGPGETGVAAATQHDDAQLVFPLAEAAE